MQHGAGIWPIPVNIQVKAPFTGWPASSGGVSIAVDKNNVVRLQAGILHCGGRDQHAILKPDADISGCALVQAATVHFDRRVDQRFAG
jgi:hypothetical protein